MMIFLFRWEAGELPVVPPTNSVSTSKKLDVSLFTGSRQDSVRLEIISLKIVKREIHHGGEILQRGLPQLFQAESVQPVPHPGEFKDSWKFMLHHFILIWLVNDCWSFQLSSCHKTGAQGIRKFTKELAPQIVTGAHRVLPARFRSVLLTFYYFLLEIIPRKIILSIHTSGIHYSFI